LEVSRLSQEDVQVLLDAVATTAEAVALDYLWRPALADADDDMVLETAVNGAAEVVVTFNRRDFGAVAETFGVTVMSPSEAVAWVRGSG